MSKFNKLIMTGSDVGIKLFSNLIVPYRNGVALHHSLFYRRKVELLKFILGSFSVCALFAVHFARHGSDSHVLQSDARKGCARCQISRKKNWNCQR